MHRFLMSFFVALCLGMGSAAAQDAVTVEMWTVQPDTRDMNVYAPDLIEVEPGTTVTWVAKQPGHNVEFIRGGVPEGVDLFRSGIVPEISYTFETPGVYLYKCTPHYGLGMIGVVVVGGDTSNLDAVKGIRMPPNSAKRGQAIFQQIESGA